jgi:hypothetical protein
MLHLAPQPQPQEPLHYAEAVSRLASVRHAIGLVEPFGSGPASDLHDDEALAAAWDQADEAKRRLFDRRSGRMVAEASAGIEALLIERQEGREPAAAASEALVRQIRRELEDVARIVLG